MEYYNCNNDSWVSQLSNYIQLQRIRKYKIAYIIFQYKFDIQFVNTDKQEQYYQKLKFCEELHSKLNFQAVKENVAVSITISKWFNTSKDPNNVCSRLEKQCFLDKYETKRQTEDIFVYDECNHKNLKQNIR